MFENSEQLKSYLKKESKKTGITLINCYNTFFARNLLTRISKLSYGQLIVKGSFSQFVHAGKLVRPITDIDLVSREQHNDPLITLFKAMYDDKEKIQYDLLKFPIKTKTGVIKISTVSLFDKIKHPITIDFKPNSHTSYEIQYKKVPKVFSRDEEFYINTPSFEEHLAEKACIILESVKSDVLNTRVKDFYDIYQLHGSGYDNEKFSHYFQMMIHDRGKADISKLSTNHLNHQFVIKHQALWESMSKKYEFLDKEVDLVEATYYTRAVLSEQIQKLNVSSIKYLDMKIKKI